MTCMFCYEPGKAHTNMPFRIHQLPDGTYVLVIIGHNKAIYTTPIQKVEDFLTDVDPGDENDVD